MSKIQRQPVANKVYWCKHHKKNSSHVSKDCNILNKKRDEAIKKVVVDEAVEAGKVNKSKKWCSFHKYNYSHTSEKCFKLFKTLEKLDEVQTPDESDETQETDQIFESCLSISRLLCSLLFVCVLYLYFLILFHFAN